MDFRIFNVRMWSFIRMRAYTHGGWGGHRQRANTTFLTRKISHNFVLCSWRAATNPFHWNIFYIPVRIWSISEKSTSMQIRWRCGSTSFLRILSSTFWKRLIFSTSCRWVFLKKYKLFDCMNERVRFDMALKKIWCGADSDLLDSYFLCIENVWVALIWPSRLTGR